MIEILRKMEDLLSSRKAFWYGDRDVEFVCKSHYVEYDDMLNREVCYADYSVEEKTASCSIRVTDQMFELTVNSISGALKGPSFLAFLTAQGHCVVTGPANGAAAFFINGNRIESELTMNGKELKSALAYDTKICAVLRNNPSIVQQWLQTSINQWLSDEKQIGISANYREENNVLTVTVEARVAVSAVEIDMSTDDDADVLRWKEASWAEACMDYADLDKAQALAIVAENGISPPEDADATGWYRNEFGGNANAFILRFEHRIPDTSNDYREDLELHPAGFPKSYQHPGFVTVDNDFFQCTIDTKRRRVTGLHRKWQRIETSTLFVAHENIPDKSHLQ